MTRTPLSPEARIKRTTDMQARAIELGLFLKMCSSCGEVISETPADRPTVSHGCHFDVSCLLEWGMTREAAEQMVAKHERRAA